MIKIAYTKSFLKRFRKLDPYLQQEALDKIDQFKDRNSHKRLSVHKSSGKYDNYYSFSINIKDRIVFKFVKKDIAIFYNIGDHDVYK